MVKTINHLMGPMARRVRLMVSRGVIAVVNDALKEQGVQVSLLAEEVRDCERYQEYGFTSVPLPGAEAITVCVGGSRDHAVVIATGDRRYRLKGLQGGEVALYDDQGQAIKLGRNKEITVTGCDKLTAVVAVETKITCPTVIAVASAKVRLETPLLEVTGEIKDRCDSDGKSMESMRTTYDSHTHLENNVNGGSTNAPNQTMG